MILKEKTVDEKGRTVLVCEKRVLFFWKRERKFVAQKEYPPGYCTWLELPKQNLVLDSRLSFQLDAWNRETT